MSFFDLLQLLGANIWLYGIVFILILSVLVFVHEWGHYIVARLCGVRVETFSIGFGKELFGFHDKHGTRWRFALIPMGGYVKLFGDSDPASAQKAEGVCEATTGEIRAYTEAERKETFFAKPVWQRALIVAAGPAINYIFAIILLAALFMTNGQPVTPPLAAAIIVGSSAEKNGFQPHDKLLSIDGKQIITFEDIRREMLIGLDQKKHFIVERGGQNVDIFAAPEKMEITDRFGFKHSRGMLGLISPRHAIDIKSIRKIEDVEFAEGADLALVRAEIEKRFDTSFTVHIERGMEKDDLIIHPMRDVNNGFANEASEDFNILFISPKQGQEFVKFQPLQAGWQAVKESWVVTVGTLEALGQMVTGTRSPQELGGVIRMGAMAGDMAQQGLVAVILFTALLSINLGLINLFPIPMLDGGHLVFYAVEAVSGKPIPDQIQEYAFRFGLVFLVTLMVYANLNDLLQLFL